MAKYSREQRDRAVDLYIKYERCAADVIRELGYPSKGVLLSWYADRLEEERTGVPSGRGERYRRYTDGQKRAAVDHYLEYGRRLSRTMRMLGYPKSKELLMAWIDELAPGRRRLRHGPVPEELKRKAVVAVASGRLKSHEAACLCSISCCGFSHDDFSGLGRACRPRNGLNWMVLVSPPERTGKDYDQHAPSTVYPSFAAERGIRRVDRAENTCQRADGA